MKRQRTDGEKVRKPHIQNRAVSRALENTQNSVKTPAEKMHPWVSRSAPSSPELPPLTPAWVSHNILSAQGCLFVHHPGDLRQCPEKISNQTLRIKDKLPSLASQRAPDTFPQRLSTCCRRQLTVWGTFLGQRLLSFPIRGGCGGQQGRQRWHHGEQATDRS